MPRQDLVAFWTGSPTLPTHELSTTLKLFFGGTTQQLPTARVCSMKLEVPPYATKKIMAEKLRLAIAGGAIGASEFGFI